MQDELQDFPMNLGALDRYSILVWPPKGREVCPRLVVASRETPSFWRGLSPLHGARRLMEALPSTRTAGECCRFARGGLRTLRGLDTD
jgi:hypothetical protein